MSHRTIAIFGALALVLVFAVRAFAHGEAQWIQDGRYRNSIGQFCCGPTDCTELADSDVTVTAGGYLVKSLRETVPFQEATPSPDGHYWRCAWGGQRRCFFAPPGAA